MKNQAIKFFNLDPNEQRAIIASALKNATNEQRDLLQRNQNEVTRLKNELMGLISQITGKEYTARYKVVFTQEPNGEISTNLE